jgi:hypothetical protein
VCGYLHDNTNTFKMTVTTIPRFTTCKQRLLKATRLRHDTIIHHDTVWHTAQEVRQALQRERELKERAQQALKQAEHRGTRLAEHVQELRRRLEIACASPAPQAHVQSPDSLECASQRDHASGSGRTQRREQDSSPCTLDCSHTPSPPCRAIMYPRLPHCAQGAAEPHVRVSSASSSRSGGLIMHSDDYADGCGDRNDMDTSGLTKVSSSSACSTAPSCRSVGTPPGSTQLHASDLEAKEPHIRGTAHVPPPGTETCGDDTASLANTRAYRSRCDGAARTPENKNKPDTKLGLGAVGEESDIIAHIAKFLSMHASPAHAAP